VNESVNRPTNGTLCPRKLAVWAAPCVCVLAESSLYKNIYYTVVASRAPRRRSLGRLRVVAEASAEMGCAPSRAAEGASPLPMRSRSSLPTWGSSTHSLEILPPAARSGPHQGVVTEPSHEDDERTAVEPGLALTPPKFTPRASPHPVRVPPLQWKAATLAIDEPTASSDRPTMDGASDATEWLYDQGKAAFERHDFDAALDSFEFCLQKLRESRVRRGLAFDETAADYRHLDDYLDLCRTRQQAQATSSSGMRASPTPAHGLATGSCASPPAVGLHAGGLTPSSSAERLLSHPRHDAAAAAAAAAALPDARTTLIMVCSPRNAPLPHLADEAVDVANVIPARIRRGGSAEDLQKEFLRTRYQCFLFAGHGDAQLGPPTPRGSNGSASHNRTLGFTSARDGGLETVRPEHLAELLGAHSPARGGALTTVFLNGCRTEHIGRRVHDAGVPYVVCWATKAEDSAARLFARSFFSSLASGRGHALAFEDARTAVRLVTRPGRLASGVPSSVPKYEMDVDPFGEAHREPSAHGFTPPPKAAGIPLLLTLGDGGDGGGDVDGDDELARSASGSASTAPGLGAAWKRAPPHERI
jgi:hypothetical protein